MNRQQRRAARAAYRPGRRHPAYASGPETGLVASVEDAAEAYRAGKPLLAARVCQAILEQTPEDVSALELLGMIRAEQNEHEQAIALFQQIVRLTPAEPRARYNLGVAYLGANQPDEAAETFEAALSLDDSPSAVWNALGSAAWAAGRRQAALAAYREAVKREPGDPAALNNLGSTLAEMEAHDEAEQVLDAAVKAAPKNMQALLNLAQVRRVQDKPDPALDVIDAALALLPEDPDALVTKGHLHLDRRAFAEARECFAAATRAAPERADAWLALGWAADRLGDKQEAIAHYRRALEADDDLAAAHFRLGEALFLLGEAEDAVPPLRYALELDPDDPYGAGLLLARLGVRDDPGAWSEAQVVLAFDCFAPLFEAHLVDELGYRVPADLRALFDRLRPDATDLALCDLGCGTGLVGAAFKDLAGEAVGVDLAPRMVAHATRRGVYDRVRQAEAAAFLTQHLDRFDLILAADLVIYIGDVRNLFCAAAASLKPGGLFLFSVEEHDGDRWSLRDSLRYAHGEAYVRAEATAAGLSVRAVEASELRLEKGEMTPGLLFALDRPT